MQRERNPLDSFPELIDLNQGSIPMDSSPSWNSTLSPVENQISNYMDVAANDTRIDFSSRARGESSSAANNSRDGENSKINLGWPGPGLDSENWSFESPSNSETLSMQTHRETMNLNPNIGHTFYASSSSSASGDNNASWGLSCKRKAVEGTSAQFYPPGGSSPSNQNLMHHHHHHHSHIPSYTSRGNVSMSSSGSLSLSPANYSEQINPTNSGGSRSRQTPLFFPSSSGLAESSARNLASRSNHERHEPVLLDTPRDISSFSRNTSVYSSPITTYPNSALNQSPHPMRINEAREIMHPYPWNGSSFDSRRSSQAREEAVVTNVRASSSRRINNLEYPNVTQDQIDWSFDPGNSNPSSSRNHYSSSGSRVGPESSSSTWLPHNQNPSRQRLSEGRNPWVPFHGGTESRIQRTHFVAHVPSSSSSPEEVGPSSRGQRRLDQRSAAGFLMDVPGEDINGWRTLAAVEGRQRLIRQVLTAMRRGVQFQAEEYMLVDPFMNGFAELQDRHRDMRLDVDNMSYEELLALEDRIGNVSTGLSDKQIRSSMKQRRFESIYVSPNLEPCCICQENYINQDDIGILDCGHEFHTECIKQWLTQKNICPICKTTGLEI